ncbi:MAG: L-lactate dehydrogenase [Actinomycetaceae bacterium]|nr:L-lactate dehydrogenase [Actinomycetaceae bacterium]
MTTTQRATSLYPAALAGARPAKVSIIGAGAVGSTLAYAAVIKGVAREVVLYDINRSRVEAEALDIAHGIQFTPVGNVVGSDDVEAMRDSDVVVITAGPKQEPGQSRLELAGASAKLMEKMLPRVVEVAPEAIYIMVTNPCDVMTYVALKITGLPRNQLFGSGTVLDTSRLRYLVGQETGIAVQNIHAYVTGEHGDSEIPLWSCSEIGNVPLAQWGQTVNGGVFDGETRKRIKTDVVNSAYEIINGKGATNYAVGLAVTNILGAVLRDESRVLTISTLLDDWQGLSDVCLSAPTVVDRQGAGKILCPPITLNERDGLTESAKRLRQVARDLGY